MEEIRIGNFQWRFTMKVPFSDVFDVDASGRVSPKRTVRIGGVAMGPGVSMGTGVSMGGFDPAAHVGKDLEVEYDGEVVVIKGVY